MLEVEYCLLVHLEVEVGEASLKGSLHYLKVLRRLVRILGSLGKELECLRVGCDCWLPMLQSLLSVSHSNKAHAISWHEDRVLSEILESIRIFLLVQ
jgi:hypothetical protein